MSGPSKRSEKSRAERAGDELEVVFHHLQARLEADQRPTHFDARWLLLELGGILRTEGPQRTRGPVARARKIARRLGKAWDEAVCEELELAVFELARGADPRWIAHPRYDMAYSARARERVERRFEAAQALGISIDAHLRAAVAKADAVLARYRRQSPD